MEAHRLFNKSTVFLKVAPARLASVECTINMADVVITGGPADGTSLFDLDSNRQYSLNTPGLLANLLP